MARLVLLAACMLSLLAGSGCAASLQHSRRLAQGPAQATGNSTKLLFLHINDQHARVEPNDRLAAPCTAVAAANGQCFGGFAKLSTAITAEKERARANGYEVVLLDAGDQFSGTLWDYYYKGEQAWTFQNLLKIQAMTLGNHEFDYGPGVLANYTEEVEFPILGCNINTTNRVLQAAIKPYTIITLSSGTKVGIVGWITEDTAFISSGGPTVKFLPVIPTVQRYVTELTNQGVGIIVGLSHSGYQDDIKIAAAVNGLDLIIGGHSHTLLWNAGERTPVLGTSGNITYNDTALGPYPTLVPSNVTAGKLVPVVQAYFASRYLGRFYTSFDGRGNLVNYTGSPLLLGGRNSSSNIADDPAVLRVIDSLAGPVRAYSNQTIGSAAVLLNGGSRGDEVNLGNLICDAMVAYAQTLDISPRASIAITNSGGIRASIGEGDITVGEVINVLPFSNWVVVKNLKGSELVTALEQGVRIFPGGPFPQVAGIRYGFDPNKAPLSRIISVAVKAANGTYEPLDRNKMYPVVTNNFMAVGGDGYTVLTTVPDLLSVGEGLDIVTIDYIEERSPVRPVVEGRIVNCATSATSPACLPNGSAVASN